MINGSQSRRLFECYSKMILDFFFKNIRPLPWVFSLVPPSQFHPFKKTFLPLLGTDVTRSRNLCGVERGGGTKLNTHGNPEKIIDPCANSSCNVDELQIKDWRYPDKCNSCPPQNTRISFENLRGGNYYTHFSEILVGSTDHLHQHNFLKKSCRETSNLLIPNVW